MNKKILVLILVVLFLPAISAGIWYVSVTSTNFTASNITTVTLTSPEGEEHIYSSDDDKSFFVKLKNNIVPIEVQELDEDKYSLFEITFARVQGDVTYYLCLTPDVKNCLAFDASGAWYRINKDYARDFILRQDIKDVYKNSYVPTLTFTVDARDATLTPDNYTWYYLVADGSYKKTLGTDGAEGTLLTFPINSDQRIDLSFSVKPDWYSVKIYKDGLLVYDTLTNSPSDFIVNKDDRFMAEVTAEWYEGTSNLYHGEASYTFWFDYDVKAVYSQNANTFTNGEALLVFIKGADDEVFKATSDTLIAQNHTSKPYSNGQLVIVPISASAKAGEHKVLLSSDKTTFTLPITVNARNYDTVKVGFIGGESASEYDSALTLFYEEIKSAFDFALEENYFSGGLLTPTQKFVDGKEQYWISAPSFGVHQSVNGVEVDSQSLGIHYVKSMLADALPARAVADGTVAFSGITTLYGNTVIIEHGQGFKSVYGHLEENALKVGDSIKMGDFIANAKPSAFAVNTTELFFGITVDGVFLNPYNFIVEPKSADSAETSDKIEFLQGK